MITNCTDVHKWHVRKQYWRGGHQGCTPWAVDGDAAFYVLWPPWAGWEGQRWVSFATFVAACWSVCNWTSSARVLHVPSGLPYWGSDLQSSDALKYVLWVWWEYCYNRIGILIGSPIIFSNHTCQSLCLLAYWMLVVSAVPYLLVYIVSLSSEEQNKMIRMMQSLLTKHGWAFLHLLGLLSPSQRWICYNCQNGGNLVAQSCSKDLEAPIVPQLWMSFL